ncbi:hypothetical protein [Phytobacter massiliensis]|uniref:hypothetical protein n=1 Tax=Phytobacter massiliensis TaxID=1485952 RepID=UPI0005C52F81|nr:hypothetical protein [Phytobacter massiliensis]
MINRNLFTCICFTLCLWSPLSYGIPNSQLSVDISAESVARVTLYYRGIPVSSDGLDFPLVVNGISQKIEQTSSNFFLVGNVDRADLVFEDSEFVLPQVYGGNTKMPLIGSFIFQGAVTDSRQTLQVPVLDDISQARAVNGLKIKFATEFTAGHYTKGRYGNVFTLIVTPVI